MTVNPFWFGVLMTIVVEIVLVIIAAIIGRARQEDVDDEEAAEQYDKLVHALDTLAKQAERQTSGKGEEGGKQNAD